MDINGPAMGVRVSQMTGSTYIPSRRDSLSHSLNSAAHEATEPLMFSMVLRLCTAEPEPTTRTPSFLSRANAFPIWHTGISASGYMSMSGTHAPWSRPRFLSTWTRLNPASSSSFLTFTASSGAPGAGVAYKNVKDEKTEHIDHLIHGLGKVVEIVNSPLTALTVGSAVSQWAETMRMEVGFWASTLCRKDLRKCHAGKESSIASVGEPWEM
ncbi:hydroxysteroid dehydrogenase 2 [Striga asiatica]|uniref:Hydroxysteroid dehydrogenase 2 n=1 Tax=Striga asiatica TaxID=4170 RepID=A0A5A7QEH2_STRAF|nr:hydroxysteroid dehydrogenase 2 [Striga asiatica]